MDGSLSVAASVTDGGTLSYQWYKGLSSGDTTPDVSKEAASGTTLSLPAGLTVGSHYYFCVITNTLESGAEQTAGSNVATVTVNAALPSVSTSGVSTITATTAAMGGNVTAGGGVTVTERGVVYSDSDESPTLAEGADHAVIGSGTGSFSDTITGLTGGTTYYVRAYATNSAGTAYGDAVSFTTTTAPLLTEIGTLEGGTEDTAYTISYSALAAAATMSDADSDALSFRIEMVGSGTLTKGGAAVTEGVTLLGAGESLVWTPGENQNGDLNAFSVKVFDGKDASASAVQVTVSVTAVNDAPTLAAAAADPTFTEGGDAVSLFGPASADSVESGQLFTGLTLTVTNVTNNDSEFLSIDGTDVLLTGASSGTTGGIGMDYSVSLAGTTASVSLSKSAGCAAADIKALVEGLSYRNDSQAPGVSSRVVTVASLTDDDGDGNTATAALSVASTVSISAVNDAPVLTSSEGTTAFTEAANAEPTPVSVDGGITILDVDSETLAFATVSITGNFQSGEDVLAFAGGGATGAITAVSYHTETGVLTLSSGSTPATLGQWQAALRTVTYANTSDTPDTGDRTVSFVVYDGEDYSAAVTKTVSVAAVNDAPEAADHTVTTDEDTEFSDGSLDTYASDADGDSLTYILVSDVGHGFLTLNEDGSFVYAPEENYNGTDSFAWKVSDGTAGSETAVLTIEVNAVNDVPVITSGASVSVWEGVEGTIYEAAGSDPDNDTIAWSLGGVDAAQFYISDDGALAFREIPHYIANAEGGNLFHILIIASDETASAEKALEVEVMVIPSDEPTSDGKNSEIIVNGASQAAGKTETATDTEGKNVTTVTVDDGKLEDILNAEGNNATVTLPVQTGADVVVGQLTGQTVKNMETKEATLEIKTQTVTYTLPASQINIDTVSAQIGQQVELKDIKVSVAIAEPPADTVKVVEDTANKNNYQIVVKPVEFTITCTSGEKTVDVSKFNGYVARTVAIPAGIDPSRITPVPTTIVMIDGKYYAKINSLTNSTYSVIYNPVEFADMEEHWAKESVNNMGSRMVVSGVGDNNFDPDREITRAEFAAIIVRTLGLKADAGESRFTDVAASAWYCGYVNTAAEYGIITGYGGDLFGPDDKLNREQAMTMIARAMKLTGLDAALDDEEKAELLGAYSDAEDISGYAEAGIAACIETGIVSGRSAAELKPLDSVTRAEVAVMAERLLEKSELI